MKSVIGVIDPFGLIQKAGKRRSHRKKTRSHKKKRHTRRRK